VAPGRFIIPDEYLEAISVVLAFSAASLSGVQTFFNFYKSFESHRAIGNRYAHLSRQCKALQFRHKDIPLSPSSLWRECEKLLDEYNQINIDAESYPTSVSDMKKTDFIREMKRARDSQQP